MNAERLLQLYDRVSDAPDAVQRLRKFILDLAVRGKLVEQDPNDEPASAYLKKISAEKRSVGRKSRSRGSTSRPNARVAGQEFHNLPETWAWTEVGDVFLYDAGIKRAPKNIDQGLWLLELEDVEKDTGRLITRLKVGDRESKSTKSEFRVGDILYGKLRPYLNKVLVANEPGVSTTEIVAIRPILPMCSGYCALAFRRPGFVEYVTRLGQGTKMPRLRTEDAIVAPFPLPPVPEQHRIVAKVDELMSLCDSLEAERDKREATRDRLTTASLSRLTAPDVNEKQFKAHADFAIKVLRELTTRPDQIKVLRQTILDLAVRGKLVEQNPNDESAEDILEREGIGPHEGPFEIPSTWAWVKVGSVARTRLGKMLDKAKNKGTLRRYLRNTNVRWFDFDLADVKQMRFDESELEEFSLHEGDVLICEGGEPGRAAVWDNREAGIYFQKALHRVRFLPFVDSGYFVKALRASADDGHLARYFTGTGIKHFTGKGLSAYLFPLPPIAEQRRIIMKVDELMAHCEGVEQTLEAGQKTQRRLLDVLLVRGMESSALEAA